MPSSAPISRSPAVRDERPLHELLAERALLAPDAVAYHFLADGETGSCPITLGDLARRARWIAAGLIERGTTGKPVLLVQPPGNDFIACLFACWHAGAIAVPAYPPRGGRHKQRLKAILADSGAKFALVPTGTPDIPGVEMLVSDKMDNSTDAGQILTIDPRSPCLIQYTSGSTANPKGVMISHQNFRSHFASLGCYDNLHLRSALSWLPPYHDMGLVLKILYAFEAGITLTHFAPDHFIQRPARWLRAISRFRSELSGGPNFAFESCLRSIRDEELEGLDLSCWKAAPCGAERIHPETMKRFIKRFAPFGFEPQAFMPGYGLAETTLIATASTSGGPPRISVHPQAGPLVSCGAPLPGVNLRIADPVSSQSLPSGEIGEIRIDGPVVSRGYWRNNAATLETFPAHGGMRTGDLGYLEDGQLYVTGRIKELLIIDGINHAPEDLEQAALTSAPEITAAAALAVPSDHRESITMVIEAAGLPESRLSEICERVRRGVANLIEVSLHRVVVVRAGRIPRTTSGKIRRAACRDSLADGTLRILHDDLAGVSAPATDGMCLATLLEAVNEITGRQGAGQDDDVISLAMSSLDATRLAVLLRSRIGADVSLAEIFAARSFKELAGLLSRTPRSKQVIPEIKRGSGLTSNILTHAQERMWFLHQFDPESAAYHVFGTLELTGSLEINHLCRAFQTVISRHDVLLSRHGSNHEGPRMWIEKSVVPELASRVFEDEAALRAFLLDFARVPFDLGSEPPIRASLSTCGRNRHILAVCVHHIAADGWSLRILAKELAECYRAVCFGKPVPAASHGISYSDFAACHRDWIDGGAVDSQLTWWKSLLSGHPGILQLPVDFPRPNKPSSAGSASVRIIPAEICNRIAAIARSHRATPFMVHLAAFLLLLRQHGAGGDLVVAIPVANRNHVAATDLVGTLVNTLPFRLILDPGDSFSKLLDRVREASLDMQANQDAPFEKIIDALNPDRTSDHAPLTQVMFDHQEIPITESWTDGVSCRPYIIHRGATQFDLSLLLTVFGDHQQLSIEYRTDLFLAESIEAMFDRHLATLDRICRDPELGIPAATGLTQTDRDWLTRVSNGPGRLHFLGQTTPSLIANRSASHPERGAVTCAGGTIDYQTLDSRSDRLASALHRHGVRVGDRVAIMLERDRDLPVAMLAVWKTGAAYLPLDKANPVERLALVLSDQAPLHVMVSSSMVDHLPPGTPVILLKEEMMSQTELAPLPHISPSDAAYVIYTSGSTGRPKGVVVSHEALANFLLSMAEVPGFTEADRLLAVTTVSFDISAMEIFLPLVTGGHLDLAPSATARDGPALCELLDSSAATVMQATPATWHMLLDSGWQGAPNLKILCGGEALDPQLASTLARMGGQLWNLYGPTETTVWSTCWRVPSNPNRISIGSPIANTAVHVVSSEGIIVPPGVPGDLWISGSGLADGYWNQEELTNARFARLTTLDGTTVRAYHTGDLARWNPDGSLQCLGRSDGQVKIRGFRVELGEIEAVIASHPQVSQARVALRNTHPSGERLVGWITVRPGVHPPDSGDLRSYLAERLPVYMLPADIGIIEAFPLTSSGKLNVSQLPDPDPVDHSTGPLTPTETQLIAVWSDLLNRTSIHPDDSWFHIGGHSLLALRLFALIHQRLDIRLPLSSILDHPTPRSLASLIDQTKFGSET